MPELCGLCHDKNDQPEELHLHTRCHMNAPLRASLKDGVLSLHCYVPECGRLVARFHVQ